MKRLIGSLLVVSVLSAVAGWAAAGMRASHRRQAIEAEARRMEEAEARKPAEYFAGLVRGADEVAVRHFAAPGRPEIRLRNPDWIARLARAVGDASFRSVPHGLWVSDPEIRLYRNHREVLCLMSLGGVLRCYGDAGGLGGDFAIGQETADAIRVLVRETRMVPPLPPDREFQGGRTPGP